MRAADNIDAAGCERQIISMLQGAREQMVHGNVAGWKGADNVDVAAPCDRQMMHGDVAWWKAADNFDVAGCERQIISMLQGAKFRCVQ